MILADVHRVISSTPSPDGWQQHLLRTAAEIGALLGRIHRIAVLGIKMEVFQPAYYVPEYAIQAGFDIVPVPVYYPGVQEIMGRPVYRTVAAIPDEVDLVNVFRRPRDIPAHVDDILAKKPKAVWLQLGIIHDAAAETFARAGIDVVQDRCLMVELRRIGR